MPLHSLCPLYTALIISPAHLHMHAVMELCLFIQCAHPLCPLYTALIISAAHLHVHKVVENDAVFVSRDTLPPHTHRAISPYPFHSVLHLSLSAAHFHTHTVASNFGNVVIYTAPFLQSCSSFESSPSVYVPPHSPQSTHIHT